jgi:hypothetical protein
MRTLPAIALVCVACAQGSAGTLRLAEKNDAAFLPFDSSGATHFTAAGGKACGPVGASFRLLGWESDSADPVCTHDTMHEGVATATLDLRWKGTIPKDGEFDLTSFENGPRIWIEAVSRGAWSRESFADVSIVAEARSEHCSLSWTEPLAHAVTYGPELRATPYGGYKEVPPLRLSGCKAGDALELHVGLVADSNRGRIDVDSFGFRASSTYDADRIFGLVYRGPTPVAAPAAAQACSPSQGQLCTRVEVQPDSLSNSGDRGHPPPTMLPRSH